MGLDHRPAGPRGGWLGHAPILRQRPVHLSWTRSRAPTSRRLVSWRSLPVAARAPPPPTPSIAVPQWPLASAVLLVVHFHGNPIECAEQPPDRPCQSVQHGPAVATIRVLPRPTPVVGCRRLESATAHPHRYRATRTTRPARVH